jgi:hypothetical protein
MEFIGMLTIAYRVADEDVGDAERFAENDGRKRENSRYPQKVLT